MRLDFATQLDCLLSRPFGKRPNPWNPTVTRLRAVNWYLAVLVRLLRSWRAAGQNGALWCERNPLDVAAIENAKRNVLRACRPVAGEPARMLLLPWEPGFSASQEDAFEIAGSASEWSRNCAQIERQRSIRHAAETVGYLVFERALLTGTTFGFCSKCGGIFDLARRLTYCCTMCGRQKTSKDSHDSNRRRESFRLIKKISEALIEWKHMKGKRSTNKCRNFVESRLRACGLIKRSPRHSPKVGAVIKAAKSEPGSPERWAVIEAATEKRLPWDRAQSFLEQVNTCFSLICEVGLF